MMEYNIQKYQFHQNGKDYVVSTGLVGERVRITCQENLTLDGPFYSNEFSLYDLRAANQFFRLAQTPEEALIEINKGIERQKTALKPGINDTMHFLGYLVIGTDNDVYNLILRRDFEPNKYGIFTPPANEAADLVLTSNYKVDGERLKLAEKNEGDLEREQTFIEEELSRAIPEINKLKKISIDIEEENALIRERIKILQNQLEQRKMNVIRLKEENANLRRDNENLNVYIKNQENAIRNRQAIQTNIKIKQRPNISPGASAVTSKFEQSALRTYLSRAGAKPTTQEYTQNLNYTFQEQNNIITPILQTQPPEYITTTYTYDNNNTGTEYISPPVYQQPQIIIPTQPIYNIQQPNISYSPKRLLRNSNYNINSNFSYNNPTYRAYLNSASKEVVYKNRVNDPNYLDNLSKSRSLGKDLKYSSKKDQVNQSKNVPYTSTMAQNNLSKQIPLSNKLTKSNSNIDIDKKNDYKLEGYNSKMGIGNNINKSNDVVYNSNMANISGNLNQEYRKPIGSRMPKVNLGNYSGIQMGNKHSNNNNKSNRKKAPDIGYSSYKPDK